MSQRRYGFVAVVFAMVLIGMSSVALAQQGGGGRGNRGGGGGGGGNFDPAQMRQRMMDRLKQQLGATDDEWKALEPKVEKVMTAQRDSRGGGRFGGGRGGRQGNNNQAETAVAKASADLRTALENKDTPADEIQKKLAAYREAREAGRKELQAAQKELKELLTARQEAVMVQMGMLE